MLIAEAHAMRSQIIAIAYQILSIRYHGMIVDEFDGAAMKKLSLKSSLSAEKENEAEVPEPHACLTRAARACRAQSIQDVTKQ